MEQQQVIPEDVKRAIKETFDQGLREDIIIEVYTRKGTNDQFNDATIALVRSLAELSDKLKVSYHTIGDEQSANRNVTRSPSVLIAPDKYHIRYTGAPVGEEGRSFMITLIMASTGNTILTAPAVEKIREQLHDKREVRVFVSPTCP